MFLKLPITYKHKYQLPFEKIFERFKHLQKKIYKLVVFFNLYNKTEIILKFRANGKCKLSTVFFRENTGLYLTFPEETQY